MILHIVPRAAWEAAQAAGVYEGDTLATEGFIHCSTEHQVHKPANFLFHGRDDIMLLVIDESRLPVKLTWEDSDGEIFPHLYAPLPLDAVAAVHEYHPEPDGSFTPPTGL